MVISNKNNFTNSSQMFRNFYNGKVRIAVAVKINIAFEKTTGSLNCS